MKFCLFAHMIGSEFQKQARLEGVDPSSYTLANALQPYNPTRDEDPYVESFVEEFGISSTVLLEA